jgi:hypothetical protein
MGENQARLTPFSQVVVTESTIRLFRDTLFEAFWDWVETNKHTTPPFPKLFGVIFLGTIRSEFSIEQFEEAFQRFAHKVPELIPKFEEFVANGAYTTIWIARI